jgi:hypothetical protein
MLDTLTEKSTVYTSDWARTYDDSQDPSVLIGPSKTTAVIWTDVGYYQVGPNHINPDQNNGAYISEDLEISFTDCTDGHTYTLSRYHTPTWNLYQKLYLEGIRSGLFLTEVPLEQSIVKINDIDYEYTRVMVPGGASALGKFKLRIDNTTDVTHFFNSAIDDFYNIVSTAIQIGKDNNTLGIPGLSIKQRLRDASGVIYYYKNSYQWDNNPKWVINQSINLGTAFIKNIPSLDNAFCQQWIDSARQKWEPLGN